MACSVSTAWRDIYCFWIKYQFTSHKECQLGGMSVGARRRRRCAQTGSFREPRGLSRLSIEYSLFAVFEPANMFLAVELDAELFDELQLRFQKIDVLFLID